MSLLYSAAIGFTFRLIYVVGLSTFLAIVDVIIDEEVVSGNKLCKACLVYAVDLLACLAIADVISDEDVFFC